MKAFTERLKELRGCESQKSFATMLNLNQQTYQRYECGAREPDLETLHRIGVSCGVSIDWLLGLSDSRDRREAPSRAATADPSAARGSSCAPSASPALTLRRATRPSEPTLSDVMAELQSLKRRVIALESSTTSSLATCG